MAHKSGFVNIVGSPNVGKSTLMNQLVGEKLSIVSSKAQTTRHRILGIVNEEDYQIVFSDTPGVVNAAYKLHENMMEYVNASISDADVLIFMTDTQENEMNHKETLERIQPKTRGLVLEKQRTHAEFGGENGQFHKAGGRVGTQALVKAKRTRHVEVECFRPRTE
jgi:GTP-binding protein Era